jgi:hypothetical protein
VNDQGERTSDRLANDVQLHRRIRRHRHGPAGPRPVRTSRSLQALLTRQHVPTLGAWVRMHSRTVARPHDGVREHRSVALCCGKLQRPDDGDGFTSAWRTVSVAEFGEPHSPVFLHHDSRRTLGRLRSLPARKRAQVPVDGRLTEMKPGYRTHVEAAKLRALLTRRHVHTGHLGHVIVSGSAGHLSPEVAGWQDMKGDQEQDESAEQ